MKVLWLARALPFPLDSGDKIYSARLASAIANADCSVVFAGLGGDTTPYDIRNGNPHVQWNSIPSSVNSTLKSLLSTLPLVAARHDTAAYRTWIASKIRSEMPDVVVLDQYALIFAVGLVRAAGFRGPLVHIAHDFETHVTRDIARNYVGSPLRKAALNANAIKARLAETALARSCEAIIVLTERDARAFEAIGAARTLVAPPGYTGPTATAEVEWDSYGRRPRRVVILGSFRWTAKQMNLKNFLKVADRVFADAGVHLDVIGDVPDGLRKELERELRATKFCGFVDDLRQALSRYRMALVIEETGGGFKLKILDYIFNRLPVAAIANALSGIPSGIAKNFVVETTLRQLAVSVVSTIDDPKRLNEMQASAFAMAEGIFTWERNAVVIRELFEKLLQADKHSDIRD